MPSILKISEAASLALHTAVYLAVHPGTLISTKDVAKVLNASEAHLSKVLQRLSRSGIVTSIRGPRGGFRLDKPPGRITLLEVYEAIEGPFAVSECLKDTPACLGKECVFGELLKRVHHLTYDYFSKTTLAKLTGVFP